MIKNYLRVLGFLFFVLSFPAFAAEEPIKVSVTILPQAYFVERIGGERVDLKVIVPAGASPETYEPSPQQLFHLTSSKLYVKVGSPHLSVENRFQRLLSTEHKNIRTVDMSSGLEDLNHEDPHIWLSPSIVRSAAQQISQALSSLDAGHVGYYQDNLRRFLGDIDRLDERIKKTLKDKKGQSFIVYHPAWGYFAAEYGLRQLAIEEEGKPMTASHLKKMIDLARSKGIKTIFVQKGFDKKSAASIAREIDGTVMEINPLERNWLKNLDDFSLALKNSLRP
jgi:zinc transport system substrate-binding protein